MRRRLMKKYKKIINAILIICVLVFAIFASLKFMGVFRFPVTDSQTTGSYEDEDTSGITQNKTPWHIVFKGFAFSVKPIGMAMVHESGCLNVRGSDDYLIQIDVEDKTADDFWNNRDERIKNIEDSGYVMELSPEKTNIEGKDYIRYIVSLNNERGADFDKSYFYVLISEADENKRFLTTIRFDKIDIDSINVTERDAVYEKAIKDATEIIADATPTDEGNHQIGTYWKENEYIDADNADSVEGEDVVVSYNLPKGYSLLYDNQAGKTYYSENDKVNVITSVIPYSWMSAYQMSENKTGAGISKIERSGQYEVNGMTYYFYAYSILFVKNEKRSCTYNFYAYTDLKNGDIYSIHGFADDKPEVMEPDFYYDFMNIQEK